MGISWSYQVRACHQGGKLRVVDMDLLDDGSLESTEDVNRHRIRLPIFLAKPYTIKP